MKFNILTTKSVYTTYQNLKIIYVKMYIKQLGFSNTWCCSYYRTFAHGETWGNLRETKGKHWKTINLIGGCNIWW
jgi:hypothetical protein